MSTLTEAIDKHARRLAEHEDWYKRTTDAILAFTKTDVLQDMLTPEKIHLWRNILELLCQSPGIGQDMLNMQKAHEAVRAGQGREHDMRLAIAALMGKLKITQVTITNEDVQWIEGKAMEINKAEGTANLAISIIDVPAAEAFH